MLLWNTAPEEISTGYSSMSEGNRVGTYLVGAMAKRLTGQVGGDTVQNDVTTSGARSYVTVAAVESDRCHFLLMILKKEKKRGIT